MKQTPRIKELLSAQTYSVEEVVEKIQVKTLLPQDNDNFFKDIIGNTNIVKYFSNMVRLLKRKRPIKGLGSYHPSFLLLGVSGIGKALTVYSFAKEMNLPIVVIDSEKLLQDFSIKIVNGLKKVIAQFDKCVVLFKNVNYSNMLDEGKMTSFLSKICQIKNSFPRSFFFASASQFAFYPQFFFGPEGFNNKVSFNSPDPKDREKLIKKFIANIPHDESLDYYKVARDFIGCSGGDIADILNKAYISCLLENKPKLTYEIINATIYSETFGNKIRKMSEKEMRLTAYHEAGHVIAGYYGSTDYKVSKVEVVFRPQSLGLTDPEADEDKLSYTREDIKGRIIRCLGGKVAEQIMFNTNTSGVSSDLSNATTLAESYFKYFGMDKTFGPICLQEDVFPSEYLNSIADARIQEMLIELESKATEVVLEHKDKLIAIAEQLIKKETLYKEEVMAILEGDKKPQATSTSSRKKPVKKATKKSEAKPNTSKSEAKSNTSNEEK